MMLRFFALAWVPVLLGGCAASPPQRQASAPTVPAELRGTIVALRAVPSHAPQPLRLLFDRVGAVASLPDATEFIVRTDGGETLAVVQPALPGLQRGDRVDIERGAHTRIDPVGGADRA